MNRKKAFYICIPFLVIIFGFSIVNLVIPPKEKSKAENRVLAQKPTLDINNIEGFTGDYETYYTDQFSFRDEFLKFQIESDILLGKSDIKGYALLDNNWIFKNNPNVLTEGKSEEYASKINEYGEALKNKKVYYVSLPHKENTIDFLLPKYNNVEKSQKDYQKFISKMDKNINIINVANHFKNTFTNDELENFYFKTDSHWNGIGAYEAFKSVVNTIAKDENINPPVDDKDYETINTQNDDFLGIYNTNLCEVYKVNENIPYVYNKNKFLVDYYLHNKETFEKVDARKVIAPGNDEGIVNYATSYSSTSIYYKTFNKNAPIKKKVLIYRDSYFSAMSWLISDMFSEVEIVDPRYISRFNNSSKKIADSTDADIVLFMFSDIQFSTMIDEL